MSNELKTFYRIISNSRLEDLNKSRMSFIKEREELKSTILSKNEVNKKLQELIINSENDIKEHFDLNNCIQSYKEIINSGFKSEMTVKVHSLISKKKEEIMQKELTRKNNQKDLKTTANLFLEDINLNKWDISKNLIQKLKFLNDQ